MQKYLLSNQLSNNEKLIIFKARNGMLKVGFNFGQKNKCILCNIENDEDNHLVQCTIVKMNISDDGDSLKFGDIYSHDMTKVTNISKILIKVMRMREVEKAKFSIREAR